MQQLFQPRKATWLLTLALAFAGLARTAGAVDVPLRILFLGDNRAHHPADRFNQLQPVLAVRHIDLAYTEALTDINDAKLAGYDGLLIYANWTAIASAQEQALLDFVAAGGGLVPLHCGSYCSLNSPEYIALVGGQFKSHGTGVFKETIIKPDHPLMQGLAPIESWDESRVHTKLTPTMRHAIISTLLRRAAWARALLDSVEKGAISRTDLAPEQWSRLKLNPNRNIARLAERLATTTRAVSADRAEIVQKLLPLAKEPGNAARGNEVFTTTCAVCHTFNGQGGKIGPDLSGIGVRDRSEILIDILDPNRSVEANYRLWNVTTKEGETFSGRLETETQNSVEA